MNEPSSMGPMPGRSRGEPSSVGALPGRVVADVVMNGNATGGGGRQSNQDDGDSLFGLAQHYLQILLRRKLVVAIVLALAVGAGYLWLQQQTPIYRASASVIIDSNPPKVLMVRDVVELGSPTHYRGNLTYFETQYRVIKSFPVAKRALSMMGLWNSEHLLGLDDADPPLTAGEKEAAFEAAYMPGVLAGRLQVRPIPNSMLVNIEFDDRDPEFAKMIVNGVSKAYEAHNLAYKRTIMDNAQKDLQKETDLKRVQLDAADQALLTYETDHNVGSIDAKKKSINTRIDDLNGILTRTRSERIRLEAQAGTLRKYVDAKDPFGVDAAFILSDEVVRALKQRIVGVQAELAALKSRYLDKHPDTLAKNKELRTLNAIARKEIQNLAKSVQKKLAETRRIETGLQTELDEAQVQQGTISGLSLAYGRLKDERDKLDETYTLLSKRLTETKMSSQFESNNVRRHQEAVTPTVPVSPRKGIVLIASFLLGLFFAFGAAVLLDYADATIKTWKDLEDQLGYKVLGVVPVIGQKGITRAEMTPEERRERDLYIHRNPASNVAEASRTLRTNLLFMSAAHDLNTLLITSANPAEGKTLMTVHTATSMASSGNRVLLVEADMRRPRLATSFGVDPDKGLSACLVGGSVEDNVQKTEVENLDVMVCGPVPPNPNELLHTNRFDHLLAELRDRYDTVIFDSPPLLPVADAMVLAQRLDGVLIVVRAGQTSRHALRHAVRQLVAVEAPIVGMVLNYQTNKKRGYGYGYGYGYGGYGGYGYKSKEPTEAGAT